MEERTALRCPREPRAQERCERYDEQLSQSIALTVGDAEAARSLNAERAPLGTTVAWRAASDRMHTLCVEAAGTILNFRRSRHQCKHK